MEAFFIGLTLISLVGLGAGLARPAIFERLGISGRRGVSVVFSALIFFSVIALVSIDRRPADQIPSEALIGSALTSEQPLASPVEQGANWSESQLRNPKDYLVTRVIDGDTIEIEGGFKVRYIGVDTPESVDPRKPVQCFGVEASRRNSELVFGQKVRLEKDVSETDAYGRLLRYIYIGGDLINERLIREGYARASAYPPDVARQADFTAAERLAREEKAGLWSACPIANQSPVTSTPKAQGASGGSNSSCLIKGNISASDEKIYHAPGCGSYEKTKIDEERGERWFCSEEEAEKAGWRKAGNC